VYTAVGALVVRVQHLDIDSARRTADARLIAAAPEMLEALLDLVALLPDPELDVDAVQREYVLAARAVIAKATGEAA
jgi:hypothetical protein